MEKEKAEEAQFTNESKTDTTTKEITLQTIIQSCLAAKGFVIFCGVITNKKDKDGNNTIDFNYLRRHYSLEDLKIAVNSLRNFATEDIIKSASIPEEQL